MAGLETVLETTTAERPATGFVFTEGPLWHPDDFYYFADVRSSVFYRLRLGQTPETVRTAIGAGIEEVIAAHKFVQEVAGQSAENYVTQEYLEELHGEMLAAAANLEFERAAQLRDRIAELKGQPAAAPQGKKRRRRR